MSHSSLNELRSSILRPLNFNCPQVILTLFTMTLQPQDKDAFQLLMKEIQEEEAKIGILFPIDNPFLNQLAKNKWNTFTERKKDIYRHKALNDFTQIKKAVPFAVMNGLSYQPGKTGKFSSTIPPILTPTPTPISPFAAAADAFIQKCRNLNGSAGKLPQVKTPASVFPSPEDEMEKFHEECQLLTSKVGRKYTEFMYIIASSNVFLRNNQGCFPAEIGFVQYSFYHGIIQSHHSFIPPVDVPLAEISKVTQYSERVHKIPYTNFDFPHMSILLAKLHKFIHQIKDGQNKMAFVFAENDEYEQIRDILEWCKEQSPKYNLKLDWNVHCFNVRALFAYLKVKSPSKSVNWKNDDAVTLFKSAKFANIDLCFFHEKVKCPNCAISKAYGFCYLLSEHFCNTFGLLKNKGSHTPLVNKTKVS